MCLKEARSKLRISGRSNLLHATLRDVSWPVVNGIPPPSSWDSEMESPLRHWCCVCYSEAMRLILRADFKCSVPYRLHQIVFDDVLRCVTPCSLVYKSTKRRKRMLPASSGYKMEDFLEMLYLPNVTESQPSIPWSSYLPFKDEAQTALFKDPVRTAL